MHPRSSRRGGNGAPRAPAQSAEQQDLLDVSCFVTASSTKWCGAPRVCGCRLQGLGVDCSRPTFEAPRHTRAMSSTAVCPQDLEPKIASPFVPQISGSVSNGSDGPVGRAISSSTACSSEEGDPSSQRQRLWARAMDSHWKLSYKNLEMKRELSRTLKSTLYQATWQGVHVVVKCAGLHDDLTSKQLQPSSQSSVRHRIHTKCASMVFVRLERSNLDSEVAFKGCVSNADDKQITDELLHAPRSKLAYS